MTRIVEGFDAAAWEPLATASPLQSSSWLTVMSSRLPGTVHTVTLGEELGFVGAVISEPDAYEAYNPHALLWRDPPVFPQRAPERRRAALERLRPDPASLLPALALVAPGYSGNPAGSSAQRRGKVRECLSDALEWCREGGLAGLYVLYTDEGGAVTGQAVAELGGTSFPLTTRWSLPVWWDDWDSYIEGLSSPRRRREVRREWRRACDAGLTVREVDPAAKAEAILDARCHLLEHYGQAADRVAEAQRLSGLAEAFGDDLTAYGVWLGNRLMAVSLCVRHGRSMHLVYTGSVEEAYDLPYAHFIAAYYAPAQYLGSRLLDEIDYGIGHGGGKALRGCRGIPVYGHAVGVDPGRTALLREAAGLLSAPSSD